MLEVIFICAILGGLEVFLHLGYARHNRERNEILRVQTKLLTNIKNLLTDQSETLDNATEELVEINDVVTSDSAL